MEKKQSRKQSKLEDEHHLMRQLSKHG